MPTPLPLDRLKSAEAQYVIQGTPLHELSKDHQLNYEALVKACREQQWDEKRLDHLTEVSVATNQLSRAITMELDPLQRHAMVADLLVQQTQDLALAIGALDLADSVTLKMLRGRAEALRTIAETAERAVKLSREARGIIAGAASSQEHDDYRGVQYEVVLAPVKALEGG